MKVLTCLVCLLVSALATTATAQCSREERCEPTVEKVKAPVVEKAKVEVEAEAEKPKVQQKKCPVMGGAINKDISVDYEGRTIYFCCNRDR